MDRNRAMLQLSLVRAVVRGARKRGAVTRGLRRRAAEIVESTARAVEMEPDGELADLFASMKEELAAD